MNNAGVIVLVALGGFILYELMSKPASTPAATTAGAAGTPVASFTGTPALPPGYTMQWNGFQFVATPPGAIAM
jgi:hypothetical protein